MFPHPWRVVGMTAKTLDLVRQAGRRVYLPACLLVFLLVACSPSGLASPTALAATSQPFRPAPPPVHTATPSPIKTALPQASTPLACLDNLTWVSDLTIPDGTEVDAQSTLDKRWEVKNAGDCNWDERYRLRLIAGPAMTAPQEQALFPARSGSKAVLQILFQAPAEVGKFRSAWQAYNPAGQPFGDPIFIDIKVK